MNSWLRDLLHSHEDDSVDEPEEVEVEAPSKTISGLVDLTDDEQTFLVDLVDSGAREFVFLPENVEASDEALKLAFQRFTKDMVVTLITSLEEKDLLLKEEMEPTLQCPKCYSSEVKIKFACPKCGSNHIVKSEIYEHPFCGYRNIKSEFKVKGSVVCPKCKSVLTNKVNNVDDVDQESYRVIGSVFECNNCHNKMNKPNIDFQCRSCGTEFNYINAIYQVPLRYIISERVYNKILSRNNVNLLIVEDFAPEAEVMSILLNSYDPSKKYVITIAGTGAEALQAFEENAFNLVILDLGLPDMNGLEVLEKIKNQTPYVKVIVYTGYDDRETAVKAMKIGASEFLIKSHEDIQSLPKVVERILSDGKILD